MSKLLWQACAVVALITLAAAVGISGCGGAPAGGPTPTIVVTQGDPMTHATAGREDCRSCHLQGTNRSLKMPADHSGYTNNTCRLCHRPLQNQP